MRLPLGVQLTHGSLYKVRLRDYAMRFVFGAVVTTCTGLIADRYGPAVGGLFLAFPAILPASLTLLAQKSQSSRACGADALGAVFGACGLAVFGALVWLLGTDLPGWLVILIAVLAWLVVSCALWSVFRLWHLHRHAALRTGHAREAAGPRTSS